MLKRVKIKGIKTRKNNQNKKEGEKKKAGII